METKRRSVIGLLLRPLAYIARTIERVLFVLVTWYDLYVYTPIQKGTAPVVAAIPRNLYVFGHAYTVFTANVVSWGRTVLIIPIAFCLRYNYHWCVFWLVVLHDYLDHVDGIVAKVQKQIYGPIDDPLLGGFMDAFCDKVVNVTCLWSILMVTDFSEMTTLQLTIYVGSCIIIMAYEFVLGVVRVQDYFYYYFKRRHLERKGKEFTEVTSGTKAVMEGKLKEKLESMGIAFLGLAQARVVPLDGLAGKLGVFCLLLSVRLAHASLTRKLEARKKSKKSNMVSSHMATVDYQSKKDYSSKPLYNEDGSKKDYHIKRRITHSEGNGTDTVSNGHVNNEKPTNGLRLRNADKPDSPKPRLLRSESKSSTGGSESADDSDDVREAMSRERRHSLPSVHMDGRVDKVFTVGCFDLFHRGHIKLMQRMRQLGKQVIVGLHDSRSYYQLKNKFPIDSTEKRMLNAKQYADQVYCITSTDPSNFITCAVHLDNDETALYIRGDDMPRFPSRSVVESLMPVRFLPYTQGVSSTKLRMELFAKIKPEEQSTSSGYSSDAN